MKISFNKNVDSLMIGTNYSPSVIIFLDQIHILLNRECAFLVDIYIRRKYFNVSKVQALAEAAILKLKLELYLTTSLTFKASLRLSQ